MRADKYFAEKFGSRTKAAEAIEKGWVTVNGKTVKPKDEIKEADEIVFCIPEAHFVSNGGYKLERAIGAFALECKDKVFVDIGASTGGFTDCLLQQGRRRSLPLMWATVSWIGRYVLIPGWWSWSGRISAM